MLRTSLKALAIVGGLFLAAPAARFITGATLAVDGGRLVRL